jgi:hypothetical protein
MTFLVDSDIRIERRPPARPLRIAFTLLTVLVVCSHLPGQAKTDKAGSDPQKSCASKLLNSPRLRLADKPLPRRFNRHPSVSLNVSEDGSIHDVKMIATSRLAWVDKAILDEARKWKFSAAPGCGIRDVRAMVIIDLW